MAEAKLSTNDGNESADSSASPSVAVTFEDIVAATDAKAKQMLARKTKKEQQTRWRLSRELIMISFLEVLVSGTLVVMAYSGFTQWSLYRADSVAISAAFMTGDFWTGSFRFTAQTVAYTLAGDTWDVGFIVIAKALTIAFVTMIDLEKWAVTNYLKHQRRRHANDYRKPTRAEMLKRQASLCPAEPSLWWKFKLAGVVLFSITLTYVVFKCLIRMITFGPAQLTMPVANRWYWPTIATITISSLLQLRWQFAMLDAASQVACRRQKMARKTRNHTPSGPPPLVLKDNNELSSPLLDDADSFTSSAPEDEDSDSDQGSVSDDDHVLDPSLSPPSIPLDTDLGRGFQARRLKQLRKIAKHEHATKRKDGSQDDGRERASTSQQHKRSKSQKAHASKKKNPLPETRSITTAQSLKMLVKVMWH